jgi:hypothetical protein
MQKQTPAKISVNFFLLTSKKTTPLLRTIIQQNPKKANEFFVNFQIIFVLQPHPGA